MPKKAGKKSTRKTSHKKGSKRRSTRKSQNKSLCVDCGGACSSKNQRCAACQKKYGKGIQSGKLVVLCAACRVEGNAIVCAGRKVGETNYSKGPNWDSAAPKRYPTRRAARAN